MFKSFHVTLISNTLNIIIQSFEDFQSYRKSLLLNIKKK